MQIGLIVILVLVLLLPFMFKNVEENLEAFLCLMGILATFSTDLLSRTLLLDAVQAPIHICLAVFIAGLLIKWFHSSIEKGISIIRDAISLKWFFTLLIGILGLLSSLITAIIAAIILVMVINLIPLKRAVETRLVILACYSIGLGAALTPLGEPLSTIATNKLNEDFSYLFTLIGPHVLLAISLLCAITYFIAPPNIHESIRENMQTTETYSDIVIRTLKVYVFVVGLTLLGSGFEPLIHAYMIDLPASLLYWINMLSAILDNATLAAAEISPLMSESTIKAILLGLLISGGMLIPGNIPNIIAAGKLEISTREWARFGLPLGLLLMGIFYVIIFF